MDIHILTIFPEMFASPLDGSILQRAQERRLLCLHLHNIRDFTADRHRVTDDAPYGGGAA
jgi:tRNA (guanine37-N1)-methyltransferase